MERLIYLLTADVVTSSKDVVHPSIVLREVDKIVCEVKKSGGWFKSEMSSLLETSVERQWRPIISEMRNALWSIGGRLSAAGLIEIIARPMIMLYPISLLTLEGVEIARSIEAKRSITPQNYIKIAKALAILYVTSQIIIVTQMYSGIGWSCLVLGLCSLAVASNDEFLKKSMPALAPQLANLDMIAQKVATLQSTFFKAPGAVPDSSSSVPADITGGSEGSIYEVLDLGLRQRKK
jgi:hypothetical protein